MGPMRPAPRGWGANPFDPPRAGHLVVAPSTAEPAADEPSDALERARELLAEGRIEDARAIYSHRLSQDSRDMKAREGIAACATAAGHAALRAGEVEKAISHYQKALEIVPFHPAADDGLRRAAAMAKERAASSDPLLAAIDRLPPVQVFREARVAQRVLSKATGLPKPTDLVKERLDERHAALAASGTLPREERVAHERDAAWRRRWIYRSLPAVALGASSVLVAATGSIGLVTWGVVFAIFFFAWDVLFVEQRRSR